MINIFVNSSIGKSLIEKYYNNNIDKFKHVCLNFLKKYEHEHYNKSKTDHNVDKIALPFQVRFNLQQAVLLDIALFFPSLLGALFSAVSPE